MFVTAHIATYLLRVLPTDAIPSLDAVFPCYFFLCLFTSLSCHPSSCASSSLHAFCFAFTTHSKVHLASHLISNCLAMSHLLSLDISLPVLDRTLFLICNVNASQPYSIVVGTIAYTLVFLLQLPSIQHPLIITLSTCTQLLHCCNILSVNSHFALTSVLLTIITFVFPQCIFMSHCPFSALAHPFHFPPVSASFTSFADSSYQMYIGASMVYSSIKLFLCPLTNNII